MTADEPISAGEVWRRFDDYRREQTAQWAGVHSHIEREISQLRDFIREQAYMPRSEAELHHLALSRRISELEERETWRNRALVTAIVLPIALLVIVAYIGLSPR